MIKDLVNRLIKKHHTNDPFEIANRKGIIITFENLGNTLGYYNKYKRIKFIHINNLIDYPTKRFVCAHELGHALLHPNANTPFLKTNTFFCLSKIEKEANKFAVELIMPDEALYDYKDTSLTIYEASEMYGIPVEVCHLKKVDEYQ